MPDPSIDLATRAEASDDNRPGFTIASFNIHCGVNGWGKPFDVVAACKEIDADVLILAEAFAPDGKTSIAEQVGRSDGYEVHEVPFSRARLRDRFVEQLEPGTEEHNWGPHLLSRESRRSLVLDRSSGDPERLSTNGTRREAIRGSWNLAVLSRVPIGDVQVLDLPRLRRERAHRKALIFDIALGSQGCTVVATHLAHLSRGSPVQIRALRRHLARRNLPQVLVGDMNCWGPLLLAMLPGWCRAVRGRTWPAWRPHSQVDHILITRSLRASSGEVLRDFGSDHRPVRARIRLK